MAAFQLAPGTAAVNSIFRPDSYTEPLASKWGLWNKEWMKRLHNGHRISLVSAPGGRNSPCCTFRRRYIEFTFRSRCTTLLRCRKATPDRICLANRITSFSVKASSALSATHWLKISPPAALEEKTEEGKGGLNMRLQNPGSRPVQLGLLSFRIIHFAWPNQLGFRLHKHTLPLWQYFSR